MNVFVLGGSKNVGYHVARRLLQHGATVTFLLRRTSVFNGDAEIQQYIKEKKAYLTPGDALKTEDVRKAWLVALEAGQGRIDLVLSTVGSTPSFSLSKGFYLDPPDLCTRTLLNLFSTIPDAVRAPEAQPRYIVITSNGITSESHKALPCAIKPLYGTLLTAPHADKLGAERLLAHLAGIKWESRDEPLAEVLPETWQATAGLPGPGEIRHLVIIRPALLTDGECRGDKAKSLDKPPYRAMKNVTIGDGYRISRLDTAHFIVNRVIPDWDEWEGTGVCLAY